MLRTRHWCGSDLLWGITLNRSAHAHAPDARHPAARCKIPTRAYLTRVRDDPRGLAAGGRHLCSLAVGLKEWGQGKIGAYFEYVLRTAIGTDSIATRRNGEIHTNGA